MNVSICSLWARGLAFVAIGFLLSACGQGTPTTSDASADQAEAGSEAEATTPRFGGVGLVMPPDTLNANPVSNAGRNAYFGDLHVHTNYSFDAFAFGTVASPYDAYRFAKGEAIEHPAGFDVQLRAPLDFYAVTDHAMFLGAVKAAADTTTEFSRLGHVQALHNLNAPENQNFDSIPDRVTAFSTFPDTLAKVGDGSLDPDVVNQIAKDAWSDTQFALQRLSTIQVTLRPLSPTSSHPQLTIAGTCIETSYFKVPTGYLQCLSHAFIARILKDFGIGWICLRQNGIEALAIPHNSNGSNGQMFKLVDWASDPVDDAWARKRIRNEPLVEVTQVKGTSETHPLLSDADEWADFEIMPYRIATTLESEPKGSYAREALLDGLTLAEAGITNAYQFGLVGATDTHVGASSLEEENFFQKLVS